MDGVTASLLLLFCFRFFRSVNCFAVLCFLEGCEQCWVVHCEVVDGVGVVSPLVVAGVSSVVFYFRVSSSGHNCCFIFCFVTLSLFSCLCLHFRFFLCVTVLVVALVSGDRRVGG
jgi:hypothetical protein